MEIDVVVGGQFGSEAKGHVAAQLATRYLADGHNVIAVRVAGPNAGHTAYDPLGRPFALRTIPVMAVVDPSVQLVIAAGSEIDPGVLYNEIHVLESAGIPVTDRLYIDGQATVLEPHHIEQEGGMHESIGSTGKGVGAARAERLMRKAMTWCDWIKQNPRLHANTMDTSSLLGSEHASGRIILEGTQGYGLGLHAGFYPYCTSSDCRSIDFLAMAGLDPRAYAACRTWVVCRTFPIRVAGNSGPLHDEVTWEQLADETLGYIKPERTTVTKKIRRIGRWDARLVREAVRANGGSRACRVALTFLDYIDPEVFGVQDWYDLTDRAQDFVERAQIDAGAPVSLITTGPNTALWE